MKSTRLSALTLVWIATVIYLTNAALAQLNQADEGLLPEDVEVKNYLRRLHGVLNESTDGESWPDPGNGSYAETQKMLDDFATRGNRASFPRIIQPISFINLIKADGTGRNTYAAMVKQVDQLNRAYSGEDARAAGYAKATDSNIRFKLAGIRYVVNDDFYDLCALPSKINIIRPRYMMSGAIHLNVYICWSQYNLGLAWLPYDSWQRQKTDESHFALGAIVHDQLLPGNNFQNGLWSKGNILTHEIGHCYGLRHPYEGDCLGDESMSDQIDDTPRMTGNPLATCAAVKNRDSCPKQAGKDDMSNYMVATADSCRNHFTPGQVEYMQQVIETYKPTLMRQLLPSCVASIDSTDYSPDLQPCLTGTVKELADGRKWCKTDPDNANVWGWACCPQSLDWDTEDCRQGTPDFSLPKDLLAFPKAGATTKSPTRGVAKTAGPTSAPTTRKPTKAPTKAPTRKKKKKKAKAKTG